MNSKKKETVEVRLVRNETSKRLQLTSDESGRSVQPQITKSGNTKLYLPSVEVSKFEVMSCDGKDEMALI